jgi:hypothetical protein
MLLGAILTWVYYTWSKHISNKLVHTLRAQDVDKKTSQELQLSAQHTVECESYNEECQRMARQLQQRSKAIKRAKIDNEHTVEVDQLKQEMAVLKNHRLQVSDHKKELKEQLNSLNPKRISASIPCSHSHLSPAQVDMSENPNKQPYYQWIVSSKHAGCIISHLCKTHQGFLAY